MRIYRSPHNPLIQTKDIVPSRGDFEVIGVFNAGVTRLGDEVIMLLRVAERPINSNAQKLLTAVYDFVSDEFAIKEFSLDNQDNDYTDPRLIITPRQTYLTSISHLRLARSKDGIYFDIEDKPSILPANKYETFGLEDPRITLIDDTFYISYVGVCPFGITTCLISTQDFTSFHHHGVIFCPDNKDVVLFPEKIEGKYYALHRPASTLFQKQHIWIAESADLYCWGNHRNLMAPRGGYWDENKIGAGAVPLKIEQGWLEIYHGVDKNNIYSLGAVLLDNTEPWKIIARSEQPILQPETDYERLGFFGNVVFSCGLILEDDKLGIYYGAADTSICYAELSLDQIMQNLKPIV
ncbi:MAG: glycoside hydrolase family 130 protein [Sedimentisphaerales bacterium]|nr:glycoside hydrolase family 130 protein [Sedimentisphaerales bacterium]